MLVFLVKELSRVLIHCMIKINNAYSSSSVRLNTLDEYIETHQPKVPQNEINIKYRIFFIHTIYTNGEKERKKYGRKLS